MKFKELKFVNGICQLDYNYYVISFTKSENKNFYSCTIFNRAKLPVDLPGIKTEIIKNNKWTKIHFSKIEIETLIKKLQAFTGNKNPKHMNENDSSDFELACIEFFVVIRDKSNFDRSGYLKLFVRIDFAMIFGHLR